MAAVGGRAAINYNREAEKGKRERGEQLRAKDLAAAQEQMKIFQKKLEHFAKQHKSELKKDPDFRAQFNDMCVQIGVDPLQSRNGFWQKFLGIGDFYHELSVKVIDVCLPLRTRNGGMVPYEDVIEGVKKTYGRDPPAISVKDVRTALKSLKSIGHGYRVIQIGKKLFISTVSFDIDEDLESVLSLAKDKGYIVDKGALPMSDEKFQSVIGKLLQEGFVWVDHVKGQPPRYYVCAMFPGFK